MNRERRTYTTEFKQAALQLITAQGLGLTEAGRRLGIHPDLLRNWKDKAAGNGGIISPGPAQPTAIEVENARLRMERDILKKSDGLLREEVPMRYRFVEDHRSVWPIVLQCDALQVTRSGTTPGGSALQADGLDAGRN